MESLRESPAPWAGYAWALGAAAACTLLGLAMRSRFDTVNIAMVYLVPVVVISLRYSRGAGIFMALLSVAAFDVVFVPPHGAFTVEDAQYILTFAIMVTVAVVISGLTHRNREQAEARARLAIEAQTERVRSALLASISHDLRTPLAVIAGASSTLAERGEGMPADERQALAHSLYSQCREMSERVAKVLQMTRLETGAIELDRDWATVPEIVSSVLRNLDERLAAHRVILELPEDLPLVRVDAALIEQVLSNLVENAAKHTPMGTVIRVRAAVKGNEMEVSVEDTGNGLGHDELERAFAKFQHGGAPGMGLGLAISRAIVALHGGRIWGEILERGCAFRFSMPLQAAPSVPAEVEG